MPFANNPAKRLLNLLEAARKQPDQTAADIWGTLLKVDPTDRSLLLRRLGVVLDLPRQAREEIEKIPGLNHAIYLEWVPAVEASFGNLNLGRSFGEFRNPLTDVAIYSLKVCSEVLSRYSDEDLPDQDELDKLDKSITDLMSEILRADIDSDLRFFIWNRLDEIHQSIAEYPYAGAKSFRQVIESAVGSSFLEKQRYEQFSKSEYSDRFWTVIARAAMILTIISHSLQIPEKLMKLLPDASPLHSGGVVEIHDSGKESNFIAVDLLGEANGSNLRP